MFRAIRALVRKDLVMTLRSPVFLVISILVPALFALLYSLIVQAATTVPIVVARDSQGVYSDQFMQIMRSMKSEDGKAWLIKTEDPERAAEMYRDGDTIGLVRIPAGFDTAAAAGRAEVNLELENINSDITKNFELRIEHIIREMSVASSPSAAVVIQENPRFSKDMSFQRYMGTGLLMFTILYAAMVNTGNLVAREWEDRTAKGIVLAPRSFTPFIVGKWAVTSVQTLLSTALVAGTLALTLDYPLSRLGPGTWLPMLALFFYGAALGMLLGVALRRSLPVVPLAAVLTLVHFLLCGFESYLRGYAHGGLVEALWLSTRYWPVASMTDQIRAAMEGLPLVATLPGAAGWMAALVAVLVTSSVWFLRSRLTFTQGQ
ncbi:ABC transporter permease [Micromonospora arborensis]|uniref:ABC transporter permease n=1 Tax=Micromonospora arborensis TaxID=2116518 RepID=UPI003442F999